MRILLDSHMLGTKGTGNERYWKNLVLSMLNFFPSKNIFLYCNCTPRKKFNIFVPKFKNGFYRIFFGFNKALNIDQFDLIHVQNFSPFIKTIPIINTIHDVCFKTYPKCFNFKSQLAFSLLFKKSLQVSDAIICVSNYTKKSLIRHYNVPPEKITVVYEAPDPTFQYIENKVRIKSYLLKKFGISDKFFLVVGNIEARKQPLKIIESYKKLLDNRLRTQLVFAGPNKLKIKPLSDKIKVLDYVSDKDLNILYNCSTSLIYFSLCEGFGLPLLEAMKTKTPVICSNIKVFREVAGSAAIFVKNEKELSSAMTNMLRNKKLRNKYSTLGYHRAQLFSWKKTARQTISVYRRVLKKYS